MILNIFKNVKVTITGFTPEAVSMPLMVQHAQPVEFPCEVEVVRHSVTSGEPIVRLPNGKTMSLIYFQHNQ